MISVCNDRAYRIARFSHHGRPMSILTTRRPRPVSRRLVRSRGATYSRIREAPSPARARVQHAGGGRTRVFHAGIVTAPALLTIDLVMALSRDSLMRPLTKLRRTGYRFAINYEFSWRARARGIFGVLGVGERKGPVIEQYMQNGRSLALRPARRVNDVTLAESWYSITVVAIETYATLRLRRRARCTRDRSALSVITLAVIGRKTTNSIFSKKEKEDKYLRRKIIVPCDNEHG